MEEKQLEQRAKRELAGQRHSSAAQVRDYSQTFPKSLEHRHAVKLQDPIRLHPGLASCPATLLHTWLLSTPSEVMAGVEANKHRNITLFFS